MTKNKITTPKGWRISKLGEVADITNGKTNTQDAVEEGNYPLFDRSITIKRSNKFIFDGHAIILPGEGAEFIPRYYSGKFDLHQRAYAIIPNSKHVDFIYLYYFINFNKDFLSKKSVGSTVKSLRLPIIESMPVMLPALNEQQKIAEILTTVDNEIDKTDQIVKKTEELKRGLMKKLLTKGIGHKKFKKTKLGEIPEEWGLNKIKDSDIELIDGDRGVNYPKKNEFLKEGHCLFLSNKNIKNDNFIFEEAIFINKERDSKLRKGKLKRNDIVLTSRGTVGNVALYSGDIKFDNIRINSGMLIFRPGKSFYPLFLHKFLSSYAMKNKYVEMGSGSAQPQLPISSLNNICIPVPGHDEQKQIADILSGVDNKIDIYKKIKDKLILLKKGLMNDLLSGEVRAI